MQYPEFPSEGEWCLTLTQAKMWDQHSLLKAWEEEKKEGEPEPNMFYFYAKDDKYVSGYKHFQTNHHAAVYVSICRKGHSGSAIIGCVDLSLKEFPERWKGLISAAKDRVDRLNSLSAALDIPEGGTCAECSGSCAEGDYLCDGCRDR
jgi:hypothetical protein